MLDKHGGRLHVSQAALVAMRTDGRVVAMVGGRDWAASRFNRAVQARRQPGSAFKTFVYLAALGTGASPGVVLADEPIFIRSWGPENFGDGHCGSVTPAQAFSASIDTVAVKVSEGAKRDTATGGGARSQDYLSITPKASFAIGTSNLSLLEMTAAYAAIAAGVYRVEPWGGAGLGDEPTGGGEPPAKRVFGSLPGRKVCESCCPRRFGNGSGRAARLPIPAFASTGTSHSTGMAGSSASR